MPAISIVYTLESVSPVWYIYIELSIRHTEFKCCVAAGLTLFRTLALVLCTSEFAFKFCWQLLKRISNPRVTKVRTREVNLSLEKILYNLCCFSETCDVRFTLSICFNPDHSRTNSKLLKESN